MLNDLFELQPSLEAIQDVIEAHNQFDDPNEPLQLSCFSEQLLNEQLEPIEFE